MASHASALKAHRQNLKRREHNREFRAKLRNALAGIRSNDLGGLSIDYASGAPYVGSRFLDLGVMGANGKFVG